MARSRNVVKIENGLAYVEATMKDSVAGKDDVPVKYTVPATPADFKAWISKLPDATYDKETDEYSGPLAVAHQQFWSGLDLYTRASLRETAAAESTIIMVDKKQVDIMGLPVDKAVLAINGVMAVSAATGKDPQNAFVVARRKLLEAGKVTEAGGVIAVKK